MASYSAGGQYVRLHDAMDGVKDLPPLAPPHDVDRKREAGILYSLRMIGEIVGATQDVSGSAAANAIEAEHRSSIPTSSRTRPTARRIRHWQHHEPPRA